MDIFDHLVLGSILAVLITLAFGLYALFRGGEFGRTYSNKLMRLRVVLQFIAVLILVAVPFFFPLYFLVTGAFKPGRTLLETPPTWWPHPWTLANFHSLASYPDVDLPRYALNTLYISGFAVVAGLASSSLVAYGFARIPFRGRGVLFAVLLATMILPAWATLIPQYMLYKALGCFATNGINMTKLESYQRGASFAATEFYADIEGAPGDPAVDRALEELRFHTRWVNMLGTYPQARKRG